MIAIWTRDATDSNKLDKIKEDIYKFVKIDEQVKVDYKSFAASEN